MFSVPQRFIYYLRIGCGSWTLGFWIRPHSAAHAIDVACAVDSAVRVRGSMITSEYLRYRSSVHVPGRYPATDSSRVSNMPVPIRATRLGF